MFDSTGKCRYDGGVRSEVSMSKWRVILVAVVVSVLLLAAALPVAASLERQGTIHVVQPGEHLAVEEQEGAEGLVLWRRGNVFLDGQVGEKGFDLGSAHLLWTAHAVEVDVAFDPADVGLLRAIGIVFEANGITDLIQ